MAKMSHVVKFTRGLLDIDTMTITESDKNGEYPYDFLAALKGFNQKYVNISITEENPITPKDAEDAPDLDLDVSEEE